LKAKRLNENKYLKSVPGMAMTQAQKKKMLKKQKRLLSQSRRTDSESSEDDEQMEELPELKI